ncbi:MAG: hypothetical protein J6A95_02935, partial [Clostridia bacterium]|nr:hypothetical protein [Clostridia bacterium]
MKNTKKILCVLFALVALTFVMAISAFAAEYEAGTYNELKTAMGKAADGDVIKITAGFVIPDVYVISKGVTIDFNGNTLETTNGYSGLNIKNAGCSLINGK